MNDLKAYFEKQRRTEIDRYLAAVYWAQRKDARSWCLHYGKLLRRMQNDRIT